MKNGYSVDEQKQRNSNNYNGDDIGQQENMYPVIIVSNTNDNNTEPTQEHRSPHNPSHNRSPPIPPFSSSHSRSPRHPSKIIPPPPPLQPIDSRDNDNDDQTICWNEYHRNRNHSPYYSHNPPHNDPAGDIHRVPEIRTQKSDDLFVKGVNSEVHGGPHHVRNDSSSTTNKTHPPPPPVPQINLTTPSGDPPKQSTPSSSVLRNRTASHRRSSSSSSIKSTPTPPPPPITPSVSPSSSSALQQSSLSTSHPSNSMSHIPVSSKSQSQSQSLYPSSLSSFPKRRSASELPALSNIYSSSLSSSSSTASSSSSQLSLPSSQSSNALSVEDMRYTRRKRRRSFTNVVGKMKKTMSIKNLQSGVGNMLGNIADSERLPVSPRTRDTADALRAFVTDSDSASVEDQLALLWGISYNKSQDDDDTYNKQGLSSSSSSSSSSLLYNNNNNNIDNNPLHRILYLRPLPPMRMVSDKERQILCRFRKQLSSYTDAFPRFVLAVGWSRNDEVCQWAESWALHPDLNLSHILEILSAGSFAHPRARALAASLLDRITFMEDGTNNTLDSDSTASNTKANNSYHYHHHYHHHHRNSSSNSSNINCHPYINNGDISSVIKTEDAVLPLVHAMRDEMASDVMAGRSVLARALFRLCFPRCASSAASDTTAMNATVAVRMYWLSVVEKEAEEGGIEGRALDTFQKIMKKNMTSYSSSDTKNILDEIQQQELLVGNLCCIIERLREMKNSNRSDRIKELQRLISHPHAICEYGGTQWDHVFSYTANPGVVHPIDPTISIVGFNEEKCSIFKSSLQPLKLTWHHSNHVESSIIFKRGDDLRQDQLATTLITVMNRILLNPGDSVSTFESDPHLPSMVDVHQGLDLRIVTYRVCGTGADSGFIELVPESKPISKILEQYKLRIGEWLRQNHYDAGAADTYQINSTILDNYVRSCAGYCVFTYLLGVGDRHYDNLMITNDARLFHIDYGFLFGHDPKPMPPPMRLSYEVVMAMGGLDSPHFSRFCHLCCKAFLMIRPHAHLLLNIMGAMMPGMQSAQARGIKKSLKFVHRRFMLHLTDEEAASRLLDVIHSTVRMVWPTVNEVIHFLAQKSRG